jgi:hypothetical protein
MTAPIKPLREATAPRRGLSRLEAAVYVGFGLNRFTDMVRTGFMPPPRVHDGVQVWDRRELDIYFDALPRPGDGLPASGVNPLDDE